MPFVIIFTHSLLKWAKTESHPRIDHANARVPGGMNVTWSYRKKQDTNNKQDNHRELHSNKANEEKESERETKGTKHSQQTVKANLFQTYHFTFQSQQIIVSWYHLHTQKTHIHLNLSSQPFSSVHSSRWLCPVGTAVFVLSSHIPWPSTDASSSSSTSSMCSQYSFVLYFLFNFRFSIFLTQFSLSYLFRVL